MLRLRPQRLSPRVLADLKKRSTIGIVFYPIVLSIVLFSEGYYQRQPVFSFNFLALLGGVCLFRLVHMYLDQRLPQNRVNKAVFVTSVLITALIWGVGYARFSLQHEELYTQLLMAACTVGLCSGGVVAFMPCIWVALVFNFCIIAPGTIALFAYTGNHALGLLFILFFLYMVIMACQQNNEYWTALENESLLEEKTAVLEKLSTRDGLTGIYNRRFFEQTFSHGWKRAIRENTPIILMICDLDNFKEVNDRYGHLAGDDYLKMIAKILLLVFRRETDIVARYGGEEFAVLMSEEEIESAKRLSEKVRRIVQSSPLEFEGKSVSTTVSVGLASVVPKPGMDREVLLSRADRALYSAKKQGRNRVCVSLDDEAQTKC